MKKILFTAIAVLMTANIFAQGIEFEHGTFEEALAKAKQENKMVFMDCYTSWCGPCKHLAKNVFTQEQVGTYFNKNFVCIKMDMESEAGKPLAQKYSIKAYPTLLWLNADGIIQHKMVGAGDASTLVETAKIANDPERNWASLEKKYNNGDRSIEFLQEFLLTGSDCGFNIKEASDAYYAQRKNEDLINATDLEIIFRTVQSTSDDKFKYVLKNKDKFMQLDNSLNVYQFIEQVMSTELAMVMRSGDNEAIENKKKELSQIDENLANKIFDGMELNMLYRSPDKTKFYNALADYCIKYEFDNSESLNQYAWTIADAKVELSKEILTKAMKIAKKSVEINANFANTDTYALTLYKLGMQEEAMKYAKKSIALAPEESKNDLWSAKLVNGTL